MTTIEGMTNSNLPPQEPTFDANGQPLAARDAGYAGTAANGAAPAAPGVPAGAPGSTAPDGAAVATQPAAERRGFSVGETSTEAKKRSLEGTGVSLIVLGLILGVWNFINKSSIMNLIGEDNVSIGSDKSDAIANFDHFGVLDWWFVSVTPLGGIQAWGSVIALLLGIVLVIAGLTMKRRRAREGAVGAPRV